MDAPGPSTTSTVSASGVEAITATLDVERLEQSGSSLAEIYDVESTVAEITKGNWTRVCLQFPDELLHDSVQVFQAIRARLPDSVELYVMADTTYGSCCVDEVAAQHVDAQMVVHYGHACLSAPARLSVLYVFPKAPIESNQAVKALQAEIQANADALEGRKHLLLLADVAYYWQLDAVADGLEASLDNSFTLIRSSIDTKAYLHPPTNPVDTTSAPMATSSGCCQPGQNGQNCGSEQMGCGCDSHVRQQPPSPTSEDTQKASRASCRSYNLPSGISLARDCAILYLGAESLARNNLLLSNASTPIISYNPKTDSARLESGRTNKMLMRRYGTIQRARDADVFGIVVGTLGVASYLPTLSYLRRLLRKHQKKSYTMAVGKLNPSKLGNFLEVECWILVACGENSIVEGSKEFLKPIVTPWEVEVALGEREWIDVMHEEKGYTLDFQKVLKESAGKEGVVVEKEKQEEQDGEGEQIGDDPEGPAFSTVTGKYRYRRTYGSKDDVKDVNDLTEQASALSIRNKESALATVLSSAGGQHLATRTFKGLDPRYGKDAPSVMQAGRSGIAREYGGEVQEP